MRRGRRISRSATSRSGSWRETNTSSRWPWCVGASATGSVLSVWQPQVLKAFGLTNLQTGFVNSIPYGNRDGAHGLVGTLNSDKTGERRWHTAIALLLAAFGLSYMSLSSSLATTIFAVACALVGAYASKGRSGPCHRAGCRPRRSLQASRISTPSRTSAAAASMVNIVGLVRMRPGASRLECSPWPRWDAMAAAAVIVISRAHARSAELRAAAA